MGVSLRIQHVDGDESSLPVVDIAESLKEFASFPWADEISKWKKVPDEQAEACRPLLQFFDDAGHTLHIHAYSELLIGVAYNYPVPASPFGLDHSYEEGYIGTDQFPREKFRTLIECFFTTQRGEMLALLGQYPCVEQST